MSYELSDAVYVEEALLRLPRRHFPELSTAKKVQGGVDGLCVWQREAQCSLV